MSRAILVTGGFGNIGGRLAALLSGKSDIQLKLGSRSAHIAPKWAPNAQTIQLDLLDIESIKNAVRDVETVVHLAALNDVECALNPELAEEVNVIGTQNLLGCAIDAGVKRIIYMSTAHVYGSPLVGKIDESHQTNPEHPYAKTHLEAEKSICESHTSNQIVGIRIRSANGFGAPMDARVKIWQILVNDLCRQATESRSLTLKSHGEQQRNFVPLTDLCQAIDHLIRIDKLIVGDGLFNIGANRSYSIWDMANLVALRCENVLGFNPKIIRPQKVTDESWASLDYRSDKLQDTGFTPKTQMQIEIDNLLKFCATEFRFHA